MALPRTLTFSPSPTVTREAVTRTTVAGLPGFFHAFNYSPRPSYRFSMDIGPLLRHEAESLSALFGFLQGGRSFYWDGGQYGLIDECFIAQADGVRKTYFLPNRWIDAASYTVKTRRYSGGSYTDSTWTHAIASLTSASGVLTFDTVPYSGDHIRAAYCCRYRVFFPPEGLKLDQFRPGLYNAQIQLIENPGAIVDPVGRPTWYQITLNAGAQISARMTEHAPIQRMALRAQVSEISNVGRTYIPLTLPSTLHQVSMATGLRTSARITEHLPVWHKTLAARTRAVPAISRVITSSAVTGVTSFGTNVVAGSASTTTINMTTTSQFITGVPYWNTTWWISSRSASLNVVTFATPANSGGSRFDWSIVGS
jgi:hypothetical protein